MRIPASRWSIPPVESTVASPRSHTVASSPCPADSWNGRSRSSGASTRSSSLTRSMIPASWGPRDLPTDSAVFGLGVDLNDRVLVIQDGYARCGGCIVAQWFERDGSPLTGQFTLFTGFSAGPATWFELAPLIGGGLAVRRM